MSDRSFKSIVSKTYVLHYYCKEKYAEQEKAEKLATELKKKTAKFLENDDTDEGTIKAVRHAESYAQSIFDEDYKKEAASFQNFRRSLEKINCNILETERNGYVDYCQEMSEELLKGSGEPAKRAKSLFKKTKGISNATEKSAEAFLNEYSDLIDLLNHSSIKNTTEIELMIWRAIVRTVQDIRDPKVFVNLWMALQGNRELRVPKYDREIITPAVYGGMEYENSRLYGRPVSDGLRIAYLNLSFSEKVFEMIPDEEKIHFAAEMFYVDIKRDDFAFALSNGDVGIFKPDENRDNDIFIMHGHFIHVSPYETFVYLTPKRVVENSKYFHCVYQMLKEDFDFSVWMEPDTMCNRFENELQEIVFDLNQKETELGIWGREEMIDDWCRVLYNAYAPMAKEVLSKWKDYCEHLDEYTRKESDKEKYSIRYSDLETAILEELGDIKIKVTSM